MPTKYPLHRELMAQMLKDAMAKQPELHDDLAMLADELEDDGYLDPGWAAD